MNPRDNRAFCKDLELLDKLEAGVKTISDAVSVTLGPKGRTVLIEPRIGTPKATKDGVSVAREVFLEDSYSNMAAQLVKEAAVKTNEISGDGTTTATLLAYSIFKEAADAVRKGKNPVSVRRGMEAAVTKALEAIKKISVKVEGEDLKRVACISANDEKIGSLVYEALKEDSKRVVTVEDAFGREATIEKVEGMKIPNGFISQHFVTDSDRYEAVLEDAMVALVNGKLTTQDDVLPILSAVVKEKKPLLLVAEDISGGALELIVINKLRGAVPAVAVKLTAFGNHKVEALDDIAVITGGRVFGSSGGSLATPLPSDFGHAKKVVVSSDSTIISGGTGDSESIEKRKKEILAQIGKEKAQYDQNRLKERYSRITGGVTIIKVGGSTDSEIQEIKERVEDAIQATQAAAEDGILPGGGTSLAYVAGQGLQLPSVGEDDGFFDGFLAVIKALKAPMAKILENAGFDRKAVEIAVNAAEEDLGRGLEVGSGVPQDMAGVGVLDPAKVTMTALSNAGSIAQLLIGSSVGVTFIKKGSTMDLK